MDMEQNYVTVTRCIFGVRQEELAAANLAKFRKAQHDLEQAEERAEAAENATARMRTTSRNSVSASRVTSRPRVAVIEQLKMRPIATHVA